MARPRTKIQRESDRTTIANLILKHWTQEEIAAFLEIDQSTVSRDIKVIEQRWRESSIRDFELDRAMELDRIAITEKEYWAAWQRSCEQKETSIREQLRNAIATVEGEVAAGSGRVKSVTRLERRDGDVAFLNGILKCIELRSQILGLKADINTRAWDLAVIHSNEQINSFFNKIASSPNIPIAVQQELLEIATAES